MEYSVFICHSYVHSDIYDELRNRLRRASHFSLRNESIPEHMLVRGVGAEELRAEIRARIKRSDVVLVLIANRRSWLRDEMDFAKEFGKPIIAITRRKRDRKSSLVLKNASCHVDTWRVDDVIRAIRTEVSKARKFAEREKVIPSKTDDKDGGPSSAAVKDVLSNIKSIPTPDRSLSPVPPPSRWWYRVLPRRT
jgi:hypothetical protein